MNKLGAVLLTVLIMLLISGGAGYYITDKYSKDKTDLNNQITALNKQITDLKATSTATTSTSTTDTSSWKTYTNSTYKFSFKYPSDWTVAEKTLTNNGDVIVTATINNNTNPQNISIRYSSSSASSVASTSNTIAVWIKDQFASSITAASVQSKQINGITFKQAIMQADPNYVTYLAVHNSGIYAIDFSDQSAFSEMTDAENTILSTFQFTN